METRKLSLQEMEVTEGGGCSERAEKFIAVTGLVASIAASTGPIGFLIAGPSALGMGVLSVYCAFA